MINSLKIIKIIDARDKVHREVVSSYEGLNMEEEENPEKESGRHTQDRDTKSELGIVCKRKASEIKSREDYIEAEIEPNREAL